MDLELITIGDELLLGFVVDTNAAQLARALAEIGVRVVRRTTVGDDAAQIVLAVGEALERTGAVVTSGGLGPTSDDLTKSAVAALFGRAMQLDEAHLAWMTERWRARFDTPLPASNRHQAMIPDGADVLRNHHGTAPGIWLEDDRGRWVAMLPGVPRELRGMLQDTLIPRLRNLLQARGGARAVVRSRTVRTTGVPESLLADTIEREVGKLPELSLAYLPGVDGVDLRLTARDLPPAEADRALAAAAVRLRAALGETVYGEDDTDLARVVLERCRARALTLAVAESCTGGMLGARLTAIPGSSDVVLGGVIAYANEVKVALLEVPAALLAAHGAVSEPVARAMAAGARARTGASVGVGITGVAGPGGGSADKPVGLVWIAADVAGERIAERLQLWGDRDEIRRRAAQAALDLVRRSLRAST